MIYKKLYNGHMLKRITDPLNPLNLPPFTMRVEFYGTDSGYDPIVDGANGTWTHVSGPVWDWTYQNTDWGAQGKYTYGPMKHWSNNLATTANLTNDVRLKVLGANSTGVTSMKYLLSGQYLQGVTLFDTSSVTDMTNMFRGCSALTSVPLFDLSRVTNASYMFRACSALTSVPLFDTSSMTRVVQMFQDCRNVESGALALYTQMSTQAYPPPTHTRCFRNCGSNTVTGAAELAQIPSGWK